MQILIYKLIFKKYLLQSKISDWSSIAKTDYENYADLGIYLEDNVLLKMGFLSYDVEDLFGVEFVLSWNDFAAVFLTWNKGLEVKIF